MSGHQGSTRRSLVQDRRRPRAPGRLRLRPEVQDLEGRLLLSTFTVTDPSDSLTNGLPTVNTLRWAVGQADAATTPSTIAFSLGASPTTITLTQGQLALTNVADPVTIAGPGSGQLSISGDGASRIFDLETGVEASISGLAMEDGSMSIGGAIYNAGELTLTNCLLLNNTAPPIAYYSNYGGESGPGSGGAIFNNNGTLSLLGCTLTGNTANFGGAIAGQTYRGFSDITLTNCTLSGNVADEYNSPYFGSQDPAGGAIDNETLSGLTILSLVDCTLTGNAVVGGSRSFGGAIANYNSSGGGGTSDVTLTGCTVANNTSSSQTGGLGLSGNATLTDCTITGNSGTYGAGVQVYGDSTLDLVACTISGNASPDDNGGGFGVYTTSSYNYYDGTTTSYTPQVTLTDTIIAGNTGTGGEADDLGGNAPYTLSGTNNLLGVGGAIGLGTSDNISGITDPGLAPLGDYGGPTETMPLQPTSPAIGAGVAVPGLVTDQRGFTLTGPVAIGAFQQAPGPLVVSTTIDGHGSPLGDLDLRQAVNLADVLVESSTIAFDARAFAQPTTIALTQGQLELSNPGESITILGPGADELGIDGAYLDRVLQVDAGVTSTVDGVTIADGYTSGSGGGISNSGSLTLIEATVSGDAAAGYGGGIDNESGTLTLIGSTVSGNSCSYDGGGIYNESGTLTLIGSTLTNNSAYYGGGAGLASAGEVTVTGSMISGNYATTAGGLEIEASGSGTVIDSTVSGNSATYGGGLDNFGTLVLINTNVLDNFGNVGGGLDNAKTLTVTDSTISGNLGVVGGGIANYGNIFALTDTTVSGNKTYETGGGLYNTAGRSATVTGCTFSGNTSLTYGGGITSHGTLTLTNDTVSGNTARFAGGLDLLGGSADVISCTISGNSDTATATNYVGGIYVSTGIAATLVDTIVAGNTGPGGQASDIDGTGADQLTGSSNLIGTGGSGGLSPSSNLLNVANPGLAPLGYYGRTTETMPLLPGSPAIDAGSNALDVDAEGNPLTTDQRGLPRVVNGTVDIGAFETSGFIITPIPGYQFAPVGLAFASPLTIKVTPIHPGDPVAGGIVTLSAPTSGPSATLSATTVTLNAAGVASVTATANTQPGYYVVIASASGARVSSPYGVAGFELDNAQAYVPSFVLNWGAHDSAHIYLQADGLRDLPAGRSTDIPWSDITSFTLTFSFPLTLLAGQVSVTGITVANYGPVTVTGSGSTYTITLARPINAADRVTLVINNPELEPYTRELDVLPGDVNDDGVVNAQDVALDRDLYLGIMIPNPPAAIFGDILGDGTVDLADYNAVRSKTGTKLPPAH